ncbi:MFS transporter [soil metagenome]
MGDGLRGRLLVLTGIALVALSLRAAATAVSPLLGELRTDLGIGTVQIGVLGLLPPMVFAAVGTMTPALGRRFGLERILVVSLVITGVGSVTRALAPEPISFLVLSAVTLSGMAMGNVLLPPLFKRYFPDRIGPVTSGYVVIMALGAALPPYTDVPLNATFGWRVALASWALVAMLALLPWVVQLRGPRAGRLSADQVRLPVLRSRRAWGPTLVFAMTALSVYSMFAWLPDILIDAGLSPGAAGAMLGLYAALGILPSLVLPQITVRMANPFPLLIFFVGLFLAGYAGLILAPATATVVWVVLAGLAPGSFPMVLTLINLRTTTEAGASSLSGMVQGIGYSVASIGPLVVGLLREATGSWTASLVLLGVTASLTGVGGWYGCRAGTVEAELGVLVREVDAPMSPPATSAGTPRPPAA